MNKITSSEIINNVGFYFGPFADRRVAAFHVNRKRRNLFLTATDLTGAVLGSFSSKIFAYDRKKRYAPHIIEMVVRRLVLLLKAYRVFAVRLFFRVSKNFIANAVVRALRTFNIRFTFCLSTVPIAHNGCRKKKSRRL